MLVQEVVAKYQGKVEYVTENFGQSKLAEQYGITRYPAVFVNDILLARPRDFGFYGTGESAGRYTPWLQPESQQKFKADLTKLVELVVAGKSEEAARQGAAKEGGTTEGTLAQLPALKLTDVNGKPLTTDDLAGRVTIVDFWATWCPSCVGTLDWLKDLAAKHGDKVAIVTLAVESPTDKVRTFATGGNSAPVRWVISDAATAQSFGDVVAVPTMFVFDKSGKTARVFYGAPPELHGEAEKLLTTLLQ